MSMIIFPKSNLSFKTSYNFLTAFLLFFIFFPSFLTQQVHQHQMQDKREKYLRYILSLFQDPGPFVCSEGPPVIQCTIDGYSTELFFDVTSVFESSFLSGKGKTVLVASLFRDSYTVKSELKV